MQLKLLSVDFETTVTEYGRSRLTFGAGQDSDLEGWYVAGFGVKILRHGSSEAMYFPPQKIRRYSVAIETYADEAPAQKKK